NTIHQSSSQLIESQIQQFMLPHVRLLPSRHDFISDKSETLLESALHAGLAVDYGCNNGKCGKCKMKLVSGKVEKSRHIDYILTNQEKSQNYILSCCHRAMTDVVLETTEAVTVDDIPLQKIETKIKTLDLINNSIYILNLKTPRSQRLRFMAGQEVKLSIYSQGKPVSINLSIASCPCDDMNIQFHIPDKSNNLFLKMLPDIKKNKKYIIIEGPEGDFTLDEHSSRTLIFIAEESGFASIKSLIEHALALDMAEHIHLYWIVKKEEDLYMKNICRSWNDALDNFFFHPVISDGTGEFICRDIIEQIQQQNLIDQLDFYLSGTKYITDILTAQLNNKGYSNNQIYSKEID
ncbi:MAG: 2Fe-2S iron-sulfur cluster-binding protein, partial [Pseudomonadota bacterium]